MWRQALHHRYERVGVPVVEWSPDRSLLGALEEVTAFRRRMRVVRLALIATSVVAACGIVLSNTY